MRRRHRRPPRVIASNCVTRPRFMELTYAAPRMAWRLKHLALETFGTPWRCLSRPSGPGGIHMSDFVIEEGLPYPLGAHWSGNGTNFAVFSANATKVEVCLFD